MRSVALLLQRMNLLIAPIKLAAIVDIRGAHAESFAAQRSGRAILDDHIRWGCGDGLPEGAKFVRWIGELSQLRWSQDPDPDAISIRRSLC